MSVSFAHLRWNVDAGRAFTQASEEVMQIPIQIFTFSPLHANGGVNHSIFPRVLLMLQTPADNYVLCLWFGSTALLVCALLRALLCIFSRNYKSICNWFSKDSEREKNTVCGAVSDEEEEMENLFLDNSVGRDIKETMKIDWWVSEWNGMGIRSAKAGEKHFVGEQRLMCWIVFNIEMVTPTAKLASSLWQIFWTFSAKTCLKWMRTRLVLKM